MGACNDRYLGFCEFLHSVISSEVENIPRTIYTDQLKAQPQDDPLIYTLKSIVNDLAFTRGNELAALALLEPLTANIQQPPKKLQKCMQAFSNALLRVFF